MAANSFGGVLGNPFLQERVSQTSPKELCLLLDLGLVDYDEAWALQKRLAAQRTEGHLPNLLLLLQHPHVYTIGRRGCESDILASKETLEQRGIRVYAVDRGGQTTYHGPGQLVGYPIIDLRRWGGPVSYVRALEAVLIETLQEFGVPGERREKLTGVWVKDKKIASIGVRVSRGVTTHGFALNVCPDLTYFEGIVPCGMPKAEVTSMTRELGYQVGWSEVQERLVQAFGAHLGFAMRWTSREGLEGQAAISGATQASDNSHMRSW